LSPRSRPKPTWQQGEIEAQCYDAGLHVLVGTDEAGRGPLAGPVYAAAVCLPIEHGLDGLDDSKKISESRRDTLFEEIQRVALAFAVVDVSAATIDRVNILQASLGGMYHAVQSVRGVLAQAELTLDRVLVDGNQALPGPWRAQSVVKGDQRSWNIAAASILAKVLRDRVMVSLDTDFPDYGFAKHKGYPTKAHRAAIATHGPCAVHRRSFRGVREFCDSIPPSQPPRGLSDVDVTVVLSGSRHGY